MACIFTRFYFKYIHLHIFLFLSSLKYIAEQQSHISSEGKWHFVGSLCDNGTCCVIIVTLLYDGATMYLPQRSEKVCCIAHDLSNITGKKDAVYSPQINPQFMTLLPFNHTVNLLIIWENEPLTYTIQFRTGDILDVTSVRMRFSNPQVSGAIGGGLPSVLYCI